MLRNGMLCLGCLAAAARADVVISRGGEAHVAVVGAAHAIPAEQTAVEELCRYLGRITGARFEVVEEDSASGIGHAIYVGPTRFAERQGVDFRNLGREESVIRTSEGSLVLAGGRPRGTLYAVYIFLEDVLGVRWYTPWSEKVPSDPDCILPPLDLRRQPWMSYRDHYGSTWAVLTNEPPYAATSDWYTWIARNRLNGFGMGERRWFMNKYAESATGEERGGGWIPAGFPSHTFWYYFPPDEYYHKHPEFYSMRNGKRVYDSPARYAHSGNHLCLSNPEVQRILQEKVLDMLRRIPSADFVSIGQNDGGNRTFCDCPECRAFVDRHGNEADLFFHVVNPIADAVAREFPDKLVYTLAGYQPMVSPPQTFRPRDNVIVQSTAYSNVASRIWVWNHAFSGAFVPMRYVKTGWVDLDRRIKQWKASGIPVTGLFEEDEPSFSDPVLSELYEAHAWLTAKLTETPERSAADLMEDFLHGYFGAAGPALTDYFRLQKKLAAGWPWRMVNYDYVHRAHNLFDEAQAAVAGDPVHRERVRDLRINLDFTTLAWRNAAIADYLRGGGMLETYPYPRARLLERVLEALSETRHPYWNLPARGAQGRGSEQWSMRELAARMAQRLAGAPEYAPLPDGLPEHVRNLPPEDRIEIPLGVINYASFEPDPDAALGIAYRFSRETFPFESGVYRASRTAAFRDGYAAVPQLLGKADVQGEGFHVYSGGRFALDGREEWTPLYLSATWEYQLSLDRLKPRHGGSDVWEWYLSLKFDHGPDGVPGGKVLADRVILARLYSVPAHRDAVGEVPPHTVQQVGRWIFDGSGVNRAPDAELLRMPDARIDTPSYVEGRFGRALRVDRPSAVAVIPADPRLTVLGRTPFTLDLWFQTTEAANGAVLAEQWAGSTGGWRLSFDADVKLALEAERPGAKPVRMTLASAPLGDGAWRRATVGYDRQRGRLFGSIDGGSVQWAPIAGFPSNEEPIWFGGGSTGFFNGALDEVSVYLNALPPSCVTAIPLAQDRLRERRNEARRHLSRPDGEAADSAVRQAIWNSRLAWAERRLRAGETGPLRTALDVTRFGVGPLRILSAPFELFTQVGMDARRILGEPAWILNTTNGCAGYLGDASVFGHARSYETGEAFVWYDAAGPFERTAAEQLIEAWRALE